MIRATLVFSLFLAIPGVALAHGGAWRGPGSRAPGDPSPGAGPGANTWRTTWQLNRDKLVDIPGLQKERLAERTTPRVPGRSGAAAARDRILGTLLSASRDPDKDVATGAIIALGKSSDPRAKALLRKLVLSDGVHFTVNESAALALGMIGDASPETRRFLETVVGDGRLRTRTRALAALSLGMLGDSGALPGLMAVARAPAVEKDIRSSAIFALGLLGDELVLPDLADRLTGPPGLREADDRLRAWYAAAVGRLRSREAIPTLLLALRDKDRDVRRQAVLSLAPILTPADGDATRWIERAVASDPDQLVRAYGALALGEIGVPAWDLLGKTYRQEIGTVSAYAALGLALLVRHGIAPDPVQERLVRFLREEFRTSGNKNLRGALIAAIAIAGIQDEAGELRRLVSGKGDPVSRAQAAVALGILGDYGAIPILREALKDKVSPALEREAALALSLLADQGATKILIALLSDGESEYVRGSAAIALGRLATPETAEHLREILADPENSNTTRAFAAVALGLVIDPRPAPVLALVGDHLNHAMATDAILEALSLL